MEESTVAYIRTNTYSIGFYNQSEQSFIKNSNVIRLEGITPPGIQDLVTGLSDEIPSLPITQLVSAPGEWWCLARAGSVDGESIVIAADANGLCPVFYALIPGKGIVVSSSFRGVVGALYAMGIDTTINTDTFLTVVGTTVEEPYSSETMANEIKMLDVGQCLIIRESIVELAPRRILESHNCGEMSVSGLLDMAVESMGNSTRAFLQSLESSSRLSLSGGVDSRLVLGMLLRTQDSHSFATHTLSSGAAMTKRAKGIYERDQEIVNLLSDYYDLHAWVPGNRWSVNLNLLEDLSSFQQTASNYSYNYFPKDTQIFYSEPLLSLTGGGGELLGATKGGAKAVKLTADLPSEEDKFEYIAHQRLVKDLLPDEFAKVAVRSLIESYDGSQGNGLEEKLNSHYDSFRNRSHFGRMRRQWEYGILEYSPLNNAYLRRAADLLCFEERKRDVLVKELFAICAPELRHFPFEDPAANRSLFVPPQISRDMRATEPIKSSSNGVSGTVRSLKFSNTSEIQIGMQNFLTDILNKVLPKAGLNEIKTEQKLGRGILSYARRRPTHGGHLAAKLASAFDVLSGSSIKPTVVHISTSWEKSASFAGMQKISAQRPKVPHNNISIDPVTFSATAEVHADKLTVDVSPTCGQSLPLEWAFYLYKNGQLAEKIGYEASSSRTFDVGRDPGEYWVRCFGRRPQVDRLPTIRDSNKVYVSGVLSGSW